MLTDVGIRAYNWSMRANPWTNVYGLARTLIALATLGTLASTHSADLIRPAVGRPISSLCNGFSQVSIFCQLSPDHLEFARWVAVGLLAIVASGWRPRITGIIHWWISLSITLSVTVIDGGDQVASIATLFLLPVTLTDQRRWHWQRCAPMSPGGDRAVARIIAHSCLMAIRWQVAIIYFHAAVAKLAVDEWVDGTVVYYWFSSQNLGVAQPLRGLIWPLITHPVGVTVLTWGTLLLEIFLFMGLVIKVEYRKPLLAMGLAFHGAIAILQGLASFSMIMWGGLILYLWPLEEEFKNPAHLLPDRFRRAVSRRARPRLESVAVRIWNETEIGGRR